MINAKWELGRLVLLIGISVNLVSGAEREIDLSNLQISRSEIKSGGVAIDAIPSIDHPKFVAVEQANRFLSGSDMVMSVREGDSARAYPLRILTWHEIVNDIVDGRAIAVTYCPLCLTGMVFSREIPGARNGRVEFGVSGLLQNSAVLMYDRESMGLWSQLGRRAVSGKFAGRQLEWLSSEQMTWKSWRERYPAGQVLSTDTGFRRTYHQSPYDGYHRSPDPVFEVEGTRSDLPRKARIIGLVRNGHARAYRVDGLKTGTFQDWVAAEQIEISYDQSSRLFQVKTRSGEVIPSVWSYWFAWQAFYPDTRIVKRLR